VPLRQPYLEIIRMDMIERPYKITGLAITDIWEQVMVSLNATGYTGRGKMNGYLLQVLSRAFNAE